MTKKYILISIVIGLLLAGALTLGADYGIYAPNYFKKSGSAINPYVATDELGSSANRIAKIWSTAFDTTNLTVGGVSTGNIDMNNNLILNIGNAGTDFLTGGGLQLATNLIVGGDVSLTYGLTAATGTFSGNLVVEGDIFVDASKTNLGEFKKHCPTGYVWVPGDSKYGTLPGFCVMIYEAKCDDNNDGAGDTTASCKTGYNTWNNSSSTCACTSANSKAVVSSDAGYPIAYISQRDAEDYCRNLGEGYHLITDKEWMTIARNILFVADNWTGGSVGSGYLFNGNSGDTDRGYNGIDPDYGTEAERTGRDANAVRAKYKLSTGEYIWDVSGNVWNWTNNVVLQSQEPQCSATVDTWAWAEYTACLRYNGLNYIQPTNRGWNSDQGIGRIYSYHPSTTSTASTQYAFRRGGSWYDGANAGAFALRLSIIPSGTDTYDGIGFRCSR